MRRVRSRRGRLGLAAAPETQGRVAVGDLAASSAGATAPDRPLPRAGGHAAETIGRVLRFENVSRADRNAGAAARRVAFDCGYYDQALNRDFRDFSGMTPGAYLAARLPEGGGVSGWSNSSKTEGAGAPRLAPMKTIYPVLTYDDAPAAMDFLERAFGCERREVHEGENGGVARRAHLRRRVRDALFDERGRPRLQAGAGKTSVYVVVDETDELFGRAKDAVRRGPDGADRPGLRLARPACATPRAISGRSALPTRPRRRLRGERRGHPSGVDRESASTRTCRPSSCTGTATSTWRSRRTPAGRRT